MRSIMNLQNDEVSAAMPTDLKYQNRIKVLEVFQSGEELTAGDVSSVTGISKLTVMKAIQFFCSKGILVSVGRGQSTEVGGKKPEFFAFSNNQYLLSITMWPSNMNFTLSTVTASRIAHVEYIYELPDSVKKAFGFIKEKAYSFLKDNHISTSQLYGINLSTAGTVDYSTNHLRYSSLSPHWGNDIPVSDYMRDIFGEKPVIFIENAGKTTGRALLDNTELINKRVLVLFTTWGVSACFITRGHILSGKDSLIGEIGHMIIDSGDKEVCGCGSRGCFERLIDIRRIWRMIDKNPPSKASLLYGKTTEEISLLNLFDASSSGDEYARELVAYLAKHFATALRNISLAFNPDIVIFQGDYAHADRYFDETLKRYISSFQYYPATGAFKTIYDDRNLFDLDAQGGAYILKKLYFEDTDLYLD